MSEKAGFEGDLRDHAALTSAAFAGFVLGQGPSDLGGALRFATEGGAKPGRDVEGDVRVLNSALFGRLDKPRRVFGSHKDPNGRHRRGARA